MGIGFSDAERIIGAFFKEYAQKAPFDQYVNGAGIEEENSVEIIRVYLREPLPPELNLPETYENIPVRSVVVGEIEPQ